MLFRRALAVTCLVLAGATAPPVAAQHEAELTIEQQNALGVLDGLANQARAISDDATRIRVQSRIADAMWERSPEQSRRTYRRLFDEIDDLDESIADRTAAPVGARLELRIELFTSLYRLDPALANQLLGDLDDDPEMYDGAAVPFESITDRSATLLGAATELAARDPQLAADLGRESLQSGVAVEIGALLEAIARSNRPLADSLAVDASEAASRLGTGPLDIWGVAGYVFPELSLTAPEPAPRATADLSRRVLETAFVVTSRYVTALAEVTAAARTGHVVDDPTSVFGAQGLMMSYGLTRQYVPLFDAYYQERAAAFRVLVAQIESVAPPDAHTRVGLTAAAGETPESISARAEDTTDQAAREALFVRAAYLALERDGYDAAKRIVAKVDDAGRETALGPLADRGARLAVAERRFDDARRIADDIAALDVRGRLYADIAKALAASGKRAQAVDLLEEAQGALLKADAVMTRPKAEGLVRVANAYASLDPVRGFEVMRIALDAVNKGLARFEPPQGRNPGTLFVLANLDTSPGVEVLARTDYFRSLSLAQSIDDKALSILAQIGAVRGAMRPPAGVVQKKAVPRKPVAKPKPSAPPKATSAPPAAAPE